MGNAPLSIVRWEGDADNNVLVYRSQITDFNTGSVLIVNESQEALVYQNGIAERYGHGQHNLPTLNTPVTSKFWSSFFSRRADRKQDGSTPYSCDVYFINKVADLDVVWGTPSRIAVEDPKYHVVVNLGSNGSAKVRIKDSMRFVIGMVGQMPEYTFERLKRTVKNDIVQVVVSSISRMIQQRGLSMLELPAYLMELSDEMAELINRRLADLGLEVIHFNIDNVSGTQEDVEKITRRRDRRMDESQEIELQEMRQRRLGYSYQEGRQFDVLEEAARNTGSSGTIMNAAMGLGLGVGVGGGFAPAMRQAAGAMSNTPGTCRRCGANVGNGRFCPGCGAPVKQPKSFCTSCGAELAEGSRFCGNCGASSEPPARLCPSCGHKVPEGMRFCGNCGATVNDGADAT